MHDETLTVASVGWRPVDPWTLLTGQSVRIAVGFLADLLRLGVHEAQRMLGTRRARQRVAAHEWHRPGTCRACAG